MRENDESAVGASVTSLATTEEGRGTDDAGVYDDEESDLEEEQAGATRTSPAEEEEETGSQVVDTATENGAEEAIEQDDGAPVPQDGPSSSFTFRQVVQQQAHLPESELPLAEPVSRRQRRRRRRQQRVPKASLPLAPVIENATPFPTDEEKGWPHRRLWIGIAAITSIAAAVCAAAVISVMRRVDAQQEVSGTQNNHTTLEPTLEPTMPPTTLPTLPLLPPSPVPTAHAVVELTREERLYLILSNVTDPQYLRNEIDPRTGEIYYAYQAWQWMSWQDQTGVGDVGSAVDTARVIQRFVILIFLVNFVGRQVMESFWMVDGPNTHECDFVKLATEAVSGITCAPRPVGNTTTAMMRQVTRLVFADAMVFRGNIPREVQYLTELRALDMRFNVVSGTLPTILGQLTQLRTLILSHNQMSGTIPSELGKLRKLVDVRLDDNRFRGTLPISLSKLTQLQNFDVSFNYDIHGTLPGSFTNFQHIDVYLHRTSLTGSLSTLCPEKVERNSDMERPVVFADCYNGTEVTDCKCCTGCYPDKAILEKINVTGADFSQENPCRATDYRVEMETLANLDSLFLHWEIVHFDNSRWQPETKDKDDDDVVVKMVVAAIGGPYWFSKRYREQLCLPRRTDDNKQDRCYELSVNTKNWFESPSIVTLRVDGAVLWQGKQVRVLTFGDGCAELN